MSRNLVGKEIDRKASSKFFVIVVSALFIFGGFSVLTFMNTSADDPVWVPPVDVIPGEITIPETFDAITNFTHPGTVPSAHGLDFSSGKIYISPAPGDGCIGTSDTAAVDFSPWQPGRYIVYVDDYSPYGPPFNLGGGNYVVYFSVDDDLGYSSCSAMGGNLRITAPDAMPPRAANHPSGPPGFTGIPHFTINPATDWTELEYQIRDNETGMSLITAAEYFVCGPDPSPCGPAYIGTWVNGSGTPPDEPLPPDPWAPFPQPPQSWNTATRMFLNNSIDVTGWTFGDYWFYIHGADCGEDQICQGGMGDDNWGKDKGIGDFFYELKLTVGTSVSAPVLEWTGEPGYETDGVDPDSGPEGANFTYKIKYSDADNDPPPFDGAIRVHIEKPCGTPWSMSPFSMGFERWVGTPDNYTQGAIYNATLQLSPGSSLYAYYFNGTDGVYWAVGTPTIPCKDGPDVISTNNAPVLDWTGDAGYTTDGVNPDTGDTTITFEYRVEYTDADNDPPAVGYPELYIDKPCGADWGGPFVMTEIDPMDITYTDGKDYYYQTTLSPPAPPDFGYFFIATDGSEWATGAPTICTTGPTVTGGGTPPAAPPNLWVERSNPNIIVHWDSVTGADSYNVYMSNNRFAAFPSGWTLASEMTTSYVHAGAYGDTNTWFYVVRADNTTNGESTNSTMGVKLHKDLGTPYLVGRNIYWISLPYDSIYTKASDIVMDIEGSMGAPSMINAVCKWNPATQNAMMFMYAKRWRGQDFPIGPGDGICINSINPAWTWIITGTDASVMLGFSYNVGKGNINWISLPYTNDYKSASEIVIDIEGSLGTATKIMTVALWDPATQAVMRFYWSGTTWLGTDFAIAPGEGYYLEITSTFTWMPDLITPTVP